jgi:hypothetical protein
MERYCRTATTPPVVPSAEAVRQQDAIERLVLAFPGTATDA